MNIKGGGTVFVLCEVNKNTIWVNRSLMGAYCVSPGSALGPRKVLVNKKQQNPEVIMEMTV